MTTQEQCWLFLDWQDGRAIEELMAEYDATPAEVYTTIQAHLGIRT